MAGSTSHKLNCVPCIRSLQLLGKCPRISLRVHVYASHASHTRGTVRGLLEARERRPGVYACTRWRDGVLCVTGALGASFDDDCVWSGWTKSQILYSSKGSSFTRDCARSRRLRQSPQSVKMSWAHVPSVRPDWQRAVNRQSVGKARVGAIVR